MAKNKKLPPEELDARLLLALRRGSSKCAELLIGKGADMSRQTFCAPPNPGPGQGFLSRPFRHGGLGWAREPLCPMLAAANVRSSECCSLAWRLAGPEMQKRNFFYALWIYSRFGLSLGRDGVISEIIADSSRLRINPETARQELEAALEKSQWECAAALLSLVDPNAPLGRHPSALFAFSEAPIPGWLPTGIIDRFLGLCDPAQLDPAGDTLLMATARKGSQHFLQELLSRKLGGSLLGISHDGLDIFSLASANSNMRPQFLASLAEAFALAESREIFAAAPEAPARRRAAAL